MSGHGEGSSRACGNASADPISPPLVLRGAVRIRREFKLGVNALSLQPGEQVAQGMLKTALDCCKRFHSIPLTLASRDTCTKRMDNIAVGVKIR